MWARIFFRRVPSFSAFILACLLLTGCSAPLLKIPQPLPDIVKEYKSVTVSASQIGKFMSTGVHVQKADTLTILAEGEIGPPGSQGGRRRQPAARTAGPLVFRSLSAYPPSLMWRTEGSKGYLLYLATSPIGAHGITLALRYGNENDFSRTRPGSDLTLVRCPEQIG